MKVIFSMMFISSCNRSRIRASWLRKQFWNEPADIEGFDEDEWICYMTFGFFDARFNGNTREKIFYVERGKHPPYDGKFTFIKGDNKPDGYVYGLSSSESRYEYEIRYDAGPEDREYFCQLDCNYLARLERERTLGTKEPAVWALRELDRARGKNVDDIRAWWRSYIFPNGRVYNDVALRKLLDEAPSIFVGKLLAADLAQYLPRSNKNFARELLNIIRRYLGLKIIRPGVGQLPQPTLSASGAPASKRGIFSSEYYERKDREAEKAAEKSIKPKVM